MRNGPPFEDDSSSKFSIGETVYFKNNTNVKMIVLRFSGMRYTCVIVDINNVKNKEVICFEDDLVSEWQIPFL